MPENPDKHGSHGSNKTDHGTVLDRIPMPPMSAHEALRRFEERNSPTGSGENPQSKPDSDLSQLHPVLRLCALVGTLGVIVVILLGVLYLIGR